MTAQTHANYGMTALNRALQGDGLVSLAMGIVTVLFSNPIAEFMGLASSLPMLIVGLGVALYGLILFPLGSRVPLDARLPVLIIAGNSVWVLASAAILLFDLFALTTGGRWIVLLAADAVLVITIWQVVAWRRSRR